ncbi:hypothetical protein HK104_003498, partial [Borealophlyctis nickersoniae]
MTVQTRDSRDENVVTVLLHPSSQSSAAQENSFFFGQLQNFTKRTGIKVQTTFAMSSDRDAYFKDIQPYVNTTDPAYLSLYDIVELHGYWLGTFPEVFNADLYRLDGDGDLMAGMQWEDQVREISRVDLVAEKMVALPLSSDFGVFFTRTDLLAKYNVSFPIHTWTDLEKACAIILPLEKDVECFGAAFAGSEVVDSSLEWIGSATSSGDGSAMMAGKGKEFDFEDEINVEVLSRFVNYTKTSLIQPQAATYTESTALTHWRQGHFLFYRGRASQILETTTSPFFLNLNHTWTVGPLPGFKESYTASVATGWHLAVNMKGGYRNKTHLCEVVEFLTGKDVQRSRWEAFGVLPTWKSLYQNPPRHAIPTFPNILTQPSYCMGPKWIPVSLAMQTTLTDMLFGNSSLSVAEQLHNVKAKVYLLLTGKQGADMGVDGEAGKMGVIVGTVIGTAIVVTIVTMGLVAVRRKARRRRMVNGRKRRTLSASASYTGAGSGSGGDGGNTSIVVGTLGSSLKEYDVATTTASSPNATKTGTEASDSSSLPSRFLGIQTG